MISLMLPLLVFSVSAWTSTLKNSNIAVTATTASEGGEVAHHARKNVGEAPDLQNDVSDKFHCPPWPQQCSSPAAGRPAPATLQPHC